MLQETKKLSIDKNCFRSFGEARTKIGFTLRPKGRQGGMLIAWRTDLYEVKAVEYGIYSVSVKLLNQGSWWLLCIYSLSSNGGKEEFWIELNDLSNLVEGTWWIGGASTRSYTSEIKMIWIHFSNGKSSIHGSRTIPCLIFHSKIPFSLDPTSDPT